MYHDAVDRVGDIHRAVRAGAPISMAEAEGTVDLLLQALATDDAPVELLFRSRGRPSTPARTAVNLCILAAKMGEELGYGRAQLRELGLAALLWNIGVVRAPDDIAGPAVVERYRREGEYADVIRLAESYEERVNGAPGERQAPAEALKGILQRERSRYPDRILKALVRGISMFPVGGLVRLTTGDIGRVVARNRDFPLRPVVEVLVRRGSPPPTPVVIDLIQNPLVHVRESLVEEALP